MSIALKGSIVALITPFKNGEVDFDQIEKLIEYHIKNGTNGIVPCGSTGESATLSHKEHKEVINFTVKIVNRRIPVIAGTGSNSTDEALQLAQVAKDAGADAHLSITPYYNRPTQEGLFLHFKTIAEKVDLPMILYNVPGRTGVNLLPETVGRLAKVSNIIGIKEATGNVTQSIEVIENTGPDFIVLSGDDYSNLPLLSIGAVGAISVTANIAPKEMSEMFTAYFAGDLKKALDLHYELMPLHRAMFIETNPIPVKTAAYMMKLIDSPELRMPLCAMNSTNEAKLKLILEKYNKI